MKKIIKSVAAALFSIASLINFISCNEDSYNPLVYQGSLIQRRSEPGVYLHTDGYYYLASTYEYGSFSSILLRRVKDINEFRTTSTETEVISSTTSGAPTSKCYFNASIKFIEGDWYLFFTASSSSSQTGYSNAALEYQRPYVAKCESENPMNSDSWKVLGEIGAVTGSVYSDSNNIIQSRCEGPSVFEKDGKWYMLWSQRVKDGSSFDKDSDSSTLTLDFNGTQKTYADTAHSAVTSYGTSNGNKESESYWDCIFIGETSPEDFTKAVKASIISVPQYDWECGIYSAHSDTTWGNSNFAPEPLIHDGNLFVVFSAGDFDESFSMGILKCSDLSSILSINSWKKSEDPVFKSSPENSTFGPGSCSFTTDSGYDVMFYSARTYRYLNPAISSGGLSTTEVSFDDRNRATFAKCFTWKDNGYPDFGIAGER